MKPEAPAPHLDEGRIRAALDSVTLRSLRPVCVGLGTLYVLYSAAHYLFLPAAAALPMMLAAATTALVLFALVALHGRIPVPAAYANPAAALIAALVLANSLLHLYLLAEPEQTTNLALLIIGAGCLLLSGRWLALIVASALAGWSLIAFSLRATPGWRHFGFMLVAATALSIIVHAVRLRTHLRLERMLALDEVRQRELKAALEAQVKAGEELEVKVRERTAELAQANRLKDEFLSTLSHELRTPLTSIIGWAYLLQEHQRDADLVARAADIIGRSAEAQKRLVDDLLDVSRIITGKLRLEFRQVDFADTVSAAVEAVSAAAEAKGIDLRAHVGAGGLTMKGDPDRLQQVVWNLLSNAVKFTPRGGRVEVAVEDGGALCRLRVSDTGQGIAPEFLPHVFERFRQGDASVTRKHGGLGLGLAIVRHLVELHGGSVSAHSEGEGKGATFTVTLPTVKIGETVAAAHAPDNSHGKLRGVQVLVVEDDEAAREMIVETMSRSGADVTGVGSSSEALDALERLKPDVLVSDIGMADMDGYELIRAVRAREAAGGARIPAAALTAYAREEDRVKALRAGFDAHISKPVTPAELIGAVAGLAGVNR